MNMKNNCLNVKDWISAFVDGYLKPEEEGLLSGHLERCQSCREYLNDLKTTSNILAVVVFGGILLFC